MDLLLAILVPIRADKETTITDSAASGWV